MEEPAPQSESIYCGSCGGDPEGAVLMTCLHVLCRNCIPAPVSGSKSGQEAAYLCPVCSPGQTLNNSTSRNGTTPAVTSGIAARPCVCIEELRRRTQSQETRHGQSSEDDEDEDEDDEEEEGGRKGEEEGNGIAGKNDRKSTYSSFSFACSQHSHREAEEFCLSCHKLACSKCVTSFHRKCSQHLQSCAEAVDSQRPLLNSLHVKLAQSVVTWQESLQRERSRLQGIEEERAFLIGQIAAQREALVRALLEKEKELVNEVNSMLDKEKKVVEGKVEVSQRSAHAAEGQLSVLEAVMSVEGEAEILPLLPSLHTRLDSVLDVSGSDCACPNSSPTSTSLVFNVNTKLDDEVRKSELGRITRADDKEKTGNGEARDENDLLLTLMTSFHGRAREDTCEPLLTDILLLPTGDVILTDRDNKCVKKFNSSGHLLTRVPIPEVPSRLALVSHGKAAISVLNKKVLLFLSLLGTVRVLSSVKVKKRYCFLAAAGQGLDQGRGQGQSQGQGECQLLAATNLCDVIDLISESGVLLRRLYTAPKAGAGGGGGVHISRPLYLHVPRTHPGEAPTTSALVVDSGRRVLFGLTSDGQTTFTFRPKDDNSLECPLGVGTVPSGLILLADRDKHRVVLLNRKGGFLKQVLGEDEGLHRPCALYASVAKRLALTQVDGWVKIYRVE